MKSYEELLGAEGRRVFYRAERFQAQDLFARRRPMVRVGDARFSLDDISMTGLAASGRDAEEIREGASDEIAILFEGENEPLFHSVGEVRRVESKGAATRVALSFKGAPLDISNLVSRYNESLIKRELNGGLHHALDSVSPEYRRHCVDVLHLLRRYRSTLTRFEHPTGDPEGKAQSVDTEMLYELCEQRILPEWRSLWSEGNRLARPLLRDQERMTATKEFTEHVLTPEFMEGPIWNRSYTKPLGYPGDFGIMNYVYDWRPRGKSIFGKLLHRMGLDVVECIATRMVMVQQEIADLVANHAGPDPVRILSLGCGPAQEICNYLDLRTLPRPVEITLLDQDERALSHAYERSYPKVMGRNDGSSLRCLQVSFVEFLKVGKVFRSLPPQDLVYSVGLVDYLCMKRAQALIAAIHDKLLPAGRMVIGNVADVDEGGFWPSEFICDWSMYFRSVEEMRDLLARVPGAAPRIKPDPTGRVHMLYVDKSADGTPAK